MPVSRNRKKRSIYPPREERVAKPERDLPIWIRIILWTVAILAMLFGLYVKIAHILVKH